MALKICLHLEKHRKQAGKLLKDLGDKIDLRSIVSDIDDGWPRSFSKFIGDRIILMCRRIPTHEVDEDLRQKFLKFGPNLQRYFLMKTRTPKWVLEIYANQRVPNSKGIV
jgi:hypothetical protein